MYEIICGNCLDNIPKIDEEINLTFLDPPFLQGKTYRCFNDKMNEEKYWNIMADVCQSVYQKTIDGGAVYFMHREKNVSNVFSILEETGWIIQNVIIWKKMTSAVPQKYRYGKHYQIILFATKGKRPRVFNRIRINYPLNHFQKIPRKNGIFITDVWDDIRELTSGYFAGGEPLRDETNNRIHHQQSPISLLLRIFLSSTMPGDVILDPFTGTGTSIIVAEQLYRNSIGIEIDPVNTNAIEQRILQKRDVDNIDRYREYYEYSNDIDSIWPNK